MPIEMVDKTGHLRSPSEFAHAREVVIARMVKTSFGPNMDVELFLEFSTIVEALKLAEAISRKHYGE